MTEYLITAFTVLFTENALFACFYGMDELDKLTDDKRKMCVSALLLFVITIFTGAISAVLARILPNPRDSVIIIVPIVSSFVLCGILYAAKRLKPELYAELMPLSPAFGINTASAGIVYSSVLASESVTDAIFAVGGATLCVILSYAVFISISGRIIKAKLPSPMKGIPILLVTAGLIAMVISGFSRMRF